MLIGILESVNRLLLDLHDSQDTLNSKKIKFQFNDVTAEEEPEEPIVPWGDVPCEEEESPKPAPLAKDLILK